MLKYLPLILLSTLFSAIGSSISYASGEVNVYSARKEALIKPLLDNFSNDTGVKVNLVTGKADALLSRIKHEGRNTPADLFITTDSGRLHRAKQAGVLQAIQDTQIEQTIPGHLRDPEGYWFGLSQRSRVIFYAKDRVKPSELSSYEDLADPKWKKRICIRSSNNIYNQSLVASMIASNGEKATEKWAKGLVDNFARRPKGGDRDQIKAVAAGQCDIAVANTYYYGKMLTSKKDATQRAAANKVAVFWPNQNDRGTHVNISGAAITAASKNKTNAIKLLQYLVSDEAQQWYAKVNFEYPVVDKVNASQLLQSWGNFKADTINLSKLGSNNAAAVKLMDRAGWR